MRRDCRGRVALVSLLVLAAGCARTASHGTVVVAAASSLTNAFAGIEAAFEAAHPGVDVVLDVAASSTLREQILAGAPVDVFAPANPSVMDDAVAAGAVSGTPRVFARNHLQIAVPAGNPAGITGLADFARPDLVIGLCAAGVPCGDLARQALAEAGVTPSVDTEEPNVRALLTKIESGELDAGITYATDVVAAAGSVEGIDLPGDFYQVTGYPIAVLTDAPDPSLAAEFVSFVLSDEGRAILAQYGFTSP